LEVGELEWDEENEAHSRHGATPGVCASVLSNRPKLFANKANRTGTHMMIGPDGSGRLWTVVLLRLGGGRFRPITGWPSTGKEIQRYRGEA
jgi:hypothetical protein